MEIILKNQYLKVCLSPMGAAIHSIDVILPDQSVRRATLTFAHEKPWQQNSFYSGATLAPTSGRIRDGLLPIGSRTYTLSKNENETTHIHGGFGNLSFALWNLVDYTPGQSVTFQASLPDGADGYPGNRSFFVTYRLDGCQLTIRQHAETDCPTYINMSNHTYFNLNGFHSSGLDQYLQISAEQVIINDSSHLPKGLLDVTGTEFDFTGYKRIESQISHFKDTEQIRASRGFNHCFLLSGAADMVRPAYSLMSSDRKTGIDFYTDAPALVFYSGGFLEDNFLLSGSNGSTLSSYPGCAVALEPCFPPFDTGNGSASNISVTEREFNREIRLVFFASAGEIKA